MKTWKRALALVLALVMALSLVALPSFAEGEETGGGTESTQPVWPAEGSIKLDKDAKAVGRPEEPLGGHPGHPGQELQDHLRRGPGYRQLQQYV